LVKRTLDCGRSSPWRVVARVAINGQDARWPHSQDGCATKMPKHTLTGNIQCYRQFPSRTLGNRRDILIYLPPGYRRFRRQQYPVLYLQDGQNVFDAATAFAGVEWGVDETAQRLIRQRLIEPLIIVAVANTGPDRIHEYAPTRGIIDTKGKRKKRSRGLARKYAKFLIQELKPFIDSRYRTKPEAEFTGLGGSSLGALLTMTLGLWLPNVFTRLAVLSPSVWWDDEVIVRGVLALEKKLPLKVWLDTGSAEPGWERARNLCAALIDRGWNLYDDLEYHEFEGADHSEAAWAARVDPVLRFLYPPAVPLKPVTVRSALGTTV
jgi:predicted alpha/beta superfamily hydrolase